MFCSIFHCTCKSLTSLTIFYCFYTFLPVIANYCMSFFIVDVRDKADFIAFCNLKGKFAQCGVSGVKSSLLLRCNHCFKPAIHDTTYLTARPPCCMWFLIQFIISENFKLFLYLFIYFLFMCHCFVRLNPDHLFKCSTVDFLDQCFFPLRLINFQ